MCSVQTVLVQRWRRRGTEAFLPTLRISFPLKMSVLSTAQVETNLYDLTCILWTACLPSSTSSLQMLDLYRAMCEHDVCSEQSILCMQGVSANANSIAFPQIACVSTTLENLNLYLNLPAAGSRGCICLPSIECTAQERDDGLCN